MCNSSRRRWWRNQVHGLTGIRRLFGDFEPAAALIGRHHEPGTVASVAIL